ncbi:MAG: DUF427 domain-containing protein [Chloroflexi bacterium]|nr:MAG: DUF427 domain-containing protein [Chloroflexota bacterium]MBL1193471.1 DUF427 domain-containing protein [Chloroflexota bacterium]NOH10762.1 DUF427 domain-containing protein [Chloroflexota bacterium]
MSDSEAKEPDYWRNFKRQRPAEIVKPGPGQESVWDYPRPPAVQEVEQRIRVEFDGETMADTTKALRIVETAGAPVYYIPPQNVNLQHLIATDHTSFCEWKGTAIYWSMQINDRLVENAAWGYLNPSKGYEAIKGYLAFYAQKMDACYVGDEIATPQPGKFYGGWVTSNIVGPIKGEPGSEGW